MEGLAEKAYQSSQTNQVLRIKYLDKKDQPSIRNVEPYEIKDGKLWAYCRKKKGIRQFDMKRIQSANVTKYSYSPKWPVKIKKNEGGIAVEGLAKVAEIDYEKLYSDNPDLDQLRLKEIAANERYENANKAYMDERKSALTKGMMNGLGVGGGLGLLPGAFTRNPGLAAVGTIGGGLLGSMIGGSIADERHRNTSPLYRQSDRSLSKAIAAQDAHVNRWMELAYPDEYKEAGDIVEGLAKVAHREKDKKPFTPGAEVGQGAGYGAGLGGAFGLATGLVRDASNWNRLKEHGPNHALKNQLVGFGLGAGTGALLQHHVNKKDELEHEKVANVVSLFGNQRNRLKAGINPTDQKILEAENNLGKIQQTVQHAEGNLNELGNHDNQIQQAIQHAEGNLNELRDGNARIQERLNGLDNLFQNVGPRYDDLMASVRRKDMIRGAGAAAAGVGMAGAGLAGAVYAAKHKQQSEK